MPALGVGVMDLLRWDRNMQYYDILMLSVVLGATVWGAWKGLAWQIASLASMVVSYYVALRFRDPVAGLIDALPRSDESIARHDEFFAAKQGKTCVVSSNCASWATLASHGTSDSLRRGSLLMTTGDQKPCSGST